MTRVKMFRRLADITQATLAKQSGVSLYRIQVIERGWHQLKGDEAKRIAKVLKCKPTDLTKGE